MKSRINAGDTKRLHWEKRLKRLVNIIGGNFGPSRGIGLNNVLLTFDFIELSIVAKIFHLIGVRGLMMNKVKGNIWSF